MMYTLYKCHFHLLHPFLPLPPASSFTFPYHLTSSYPFFFFFIFFSSNSFSHLPFTNLNNSILVEWKLFFCSDGCPQKRERNDWLRSDLCADDILSSRAEQNWDCKRWDDVSSLLTDLILYFLLTHLQCDRINLNRLLESDAIRVVHCIGMMDACSAAKRQQSISP